MRECTRCHRVLPEDEFYSRSWGKCRQCGREVARERRAARRAGVRTSEQDPGRFATDRAFGVEIETEGSTFAAIADAMRAVGVSVNVEHYNHQERAAWKLVPDGSLGTSGVEVVSPKLYGHDGLSQVRRVCEALQAAGARVTRRCGLHVHHDAAGFTGSDAANVVNLYSAHRENIDAVMTPSRRRDGIASQWCRQWSEADRRSLSQRAANGYSLSDLASYAERYRDVNLTAYARHGTIEFRQHAGTLNPSKIEAWVRLTGAIMRTATETQVRPDTHLLWGAFRDLAGFDASYFEGRRAELATA